MSAPLRALPLQPRSPPLPGCSSYRGLWRASSKTRVPRPSGYSWGWMDTWEGDSLSDKQHHWAEHTEARPAGCSKSGTQDDAPDPLGSPPKYYRAELRPCKEALAPPQPVTITAKSLGPHARRLAGCEERSLPTAAPFCPGLGSLVGLMDTASTRPGAPELGQVGTAGGGWPRARAMRAPSQPCLPAPGPCRGQAGPRGR